MTEIARHSHYVPRAYLEGWSDDGGQTAHAYRLLVPHEDYRIWERRPIRSLLAFTDLYTSIGPDGGESDVFERWVNHEIETPAADSLAKVRRDRRLTRAEWRALALYVGALDVRTPTNYVEFMARCSEVMPGIMKRTLAGTMAQLEAAAAAGERIKSEPAPQTDIPFPLRVTTERNVDAEGGWLRAEVTIGRQMWVHEMRRLLSGIAKVLQEHRWSILRPHAGLEWFTSDQPVLRLNYYRPGHYDFKGGWGNAGAEILVPLSPSHLLYTKIGERRRRDETLSKEVTLQFLEILAQRASRWIIARQPSQHAVGFKSRTVDLEQFNGRYRVARIECLCLLGKDACESKVQERDSGVSVVRVVPDGNLFARPRQEPPPSDHYRRVEVRFGASIVDRRGNEGCV